MTARSGEVYRAVEALWKDVGVVVTVPTQAIPRSLSIVRLELPKPEEVPATPNEFIPTRLVVNFQVEEEDGSVVQQFSPPMVLRLEFSDRELAAAADGQELKLGVWNGTRWVVFTKKKHQLEMHSRFAIALIRHWGDATMGVGR